MKQADEAARQGVDGIKSMLLGAVGPRQARPGTSPQPQQLQAFDRLADFCIAVCALAMCVRMDA